MGLTWFIFVEIGVISLLRIIYAGYCDPWAAWTSSKTPCSFLEFLTPGRDFGATITLYISSFLILFPIVMYPIGLFVDKYINKKAKMLQDNKNII